MTRLLDLSTIRTVEDVDRVVWEDYEASPGWARNVTSFASEHAVTADDLDRVCDLSRRAKTVRLMWSMGDLYFTRFFQLPLI